MKSYSLSDLLFDISNRLDQRPDKGWPGHSHTFGDPFLENLKCMDNSELIFYAAEVFRRGEVFEHLEELMDRIDYEALRDAECWDRNDPDTNYDWTLVDNAQKALGKLKEMSSN